MKPHLMAITLTLSSGVSFAQSPPELPQSRVVIVGTPFSADKVTQTTAARLDGTQAITTENGRYFRDSQGRTREEGEIDGSGVPHILRIIDPVAGQLYAVHIVGKRYTASHTHLPWSPNRVTASQLGAVEYTRPNIGTKTIAGFTAFGHRISVGDSTTENWISPQLLGPFLMTKSTTGNRIVTTTLSNIVVGEPDPQRFQPPQGYTFVDK